MAKSTGAGVQSLRWSAGFSRPPMYRLRKNGLQLFGGALVLVIAGTMAFPRIFQSPKPNLVGCLLVASPSWGEQQFQQTVCLIVHHSAQGAVGVILNRSLPFDAQPLWKAIGYKKEQSVSARLHLGGPNSGPVVAIHQRRDLAEFVSGEDVFFAAQAENLKSLVADSNGQWKIFVGQATWGANELDRQFAEGRWLPIEVNSRIVFADVDRVWPLAVRQAGNSLIQSLTGVSLSPEKSQYN